MRSNPRTRSRGAMLSVSLAAVVLVLAACSSASPGASAASGGKTVTMSGRSFGVTEITTAVGAVSFVNADSVPHLVAEGENGTEVASPRFTQTSIAAGQTQSITFPSAGDYKVTCLIHATMNMVVHVQ